MPHAYMINVIVVKFKPVYVGFFLAFVTVDQNKFHFHSFGNNIFYVDGGASPEAVYQQISTKLDSLK